jgi:hypothetical protein
MRRPNLPHTGSLHSLAVPGTASFSTRPRPKVQALRRSQVGAGRNACIPGRWRYTAFGTLSRANAQGMMPRRPQAIEMTEAAANPPWLSTYGFPACQAPWLWLVAPLCTSTRAKAGSQAGHRTCKREVPMV